MKKKILIIGIIILAIVIGIVLIIRKNNKIGTTSMVNEIYSQYKEEVDYGVESFMKSEAFHKMNETSQIIEIDNLLKMYENNGIIKNLYYDEENKFFSFTYNTGEMKEALGGVSLKTWDPMLN